MKLKLMFIKAYDVLPLLQWQNHCQSEVVIKSSKQGDRNAWNTNYYKHQVHSKKMDWSNIFRKGTFIPKPVLKPVEFGEIMSSLPKSCQH